ncbi:hypothetical protein QTP70_019916, partial [Hemibagrus guttatus]
VIGNQGRIHPGRSANPSQGTHTHSHSLTQSHTTDNLEMPINLQCMSLNQNQNQNKHCVSWQRRVRSSGGLYSDKQRLSEKETNFGIKIVSEQEPTFWTKSLLAAFLKNSSCLDKKMQQYPMATPVKRKSSVMLAGVFYPTFHPQYEGYLLLQQKERKLITITDPNDPNRDVMTELFGERTSSSLTPTPVPNIVETPITSTPKEAEPNTAPASETRQKLHKRSGLLLFSIPPEKEMQKKNREKANRWKRKIPNQTEVHKVPREPVTFCIPLSEEEEAKKAKMVLVFGEPLAEHLTATQPAGGDIVDVPAPLNTTPPKEAEPNTAPAPETSQSEQNLCQRPGQLLFSMPPEEEMKQKKTEKANLRKKKEQKQTGVHKTRSQKKHKEPVTLCIPLKVEKEEEAKKTKIVVADPFSHKQKKRVRFCIPLTTEVQQKDEKKKKRGHKQ